MRHAVSVTRGGGGVATTRLQGAGWMRAECPCGWKGPTRDIPPYARASVVRRVRADALRDARDHLAPRLQR